MWPSLWEVWSLLNMALLCPLFWWLLLKGQGRRNIICSTSRLELNVLKGHSICGYNPISLTFISSRGPVLYLEGSCTSRVEKFNLRLSFPPVSPAQTVLHIIITTITHRACVQGRQDDNKRVPWQLQWSSRKLITVLSDSLVSCWDGKACLGRHFHNPIVETSWILATAMEPSHLSPITYIINELRKRTTVIWTKVRKWEVTGTDTLIKGIKHFMHMAYDFLP